MRQFDATQGAQISKLISDVSERAVTGNVVEVFEHVRDSDDSNFEVDVDLIGSREKQLRAVPWQAPQNGEVKVPKVGDTVIVEWRGKSKKVAIARDAVHTNQDRAPKAVAGMWRKRIDSDTSPAGDGDIYIESHTEFEKDPARTSFDPNDKTPEQSFIRISKKKDDRDRDNADLPMSLELFDSPVDDKAWIKLEMNKVNGSDSSGSWGLKLNAKTGEFKLLDANGYGIVSDGDGDFTWHYDSIDYSQSTTTTL